LSIAATWVDLSWLNPRRPDHSSALGCGFVDQGPLFGDFDVCGNESGAD
jgi:hypothetical protein